MFPPTPLGKTPTIKQTSMPSMQLFDSTPTPYDAPYFQGGLGFGLPTSGATLGSALTVPSTIQNGTVQSGMMMPGLPVPAMPPMQPSQTMQPLQPEGMPSMMWMPMPGTAPVIPSSYAAPAPMYAAPAPAMAVNSSTTSPAQMTVISQAALPNGMAGSEQMMFVGMMPGAASVVETQMPTLEQAVAPVQQGGSAVANTGRDLLKEALHPYTLDKDRPPAAITVKEAVVLPSGPMPSPGSALHGTGRCNPCAWYWKPKGCMNDTNCTYCHLCPEGELKQRKKAKVTAMRMGALEPSTSLQQGAAPRIKLAQLVSDG
jgi:hypothetical protein